jgi:hypothetical protein
MNTWKPVAQLARRSLIGLALVVVSCAGLLFGISHLADKSRDGLAQMQSATQEQQLQLSTKQDDLRDQRNNIRRFDALRAQGLVGVPNRALWVEQFEASYQRLGLLERPIYQLHAAKPLALLNAQAAPVEAGAIEPLAHDLQFELRNAHEADVLGLIADYRDRVGGRFRVNSCKLQDPKAEGLLAQCVLRFVSVPLVPPGDGAAPSQ